MQCFSISTCLLRGMSLEKQALPGFYSIAGDFVMTAGSHFIGHVNTVSSTSISLSAGLHCMCPCFLKYLPHH